MFYSIILTLAIIAGQLIKIPIGIQAGPTILDLAVILLCIIGIVKSVKTSIYLGKTPIFYLFGSCFFILGIVSLLFTPLHLTPFEYLVSFSYTLRFGAYLFLGWLIYAGIFPELKNNIEKILIYSGFSLATLGLLQLIFIPNLGFLTQNGWDPHYFRTVSTFLDPNFMGAYLSLTLLIILVSNISKNIRYLLFTITYLALVTTFSRGAFIAFAVMFIILSVLNKSFKLFILTGILSVGFVIGFLTYNHLIAMPRNIDRTQSAAYRLTTWQQGVVIFQHYPILGVGFNSYRYAIRELHLGDAGFVNARGASSNDSSLLFAADTTGIIGFIFYIGFLFTMLINAWKNFIQKKTWGVIILSAVLGLFTQSFFSDNLFYPFFLIWIILSTSMLNTPREKSK